MLQHEFWAPSAAVLGGGLASPTEDTTGIQVGGGVNFTLSDTVSGSLMASSMESREDFSLYTITGRVRVRF